MKIFYVIPVYNDEESLLKLIEKINSINSSYDNNFVIINDCSTYQFNKLAEKNKITEILLKRNQGSQKAIIIGLNYIFDKKIDFDYLIVMDSDGEDKPEDIKLLIEETKNQNNNFIIFASRRKRLETFIFKFFYFMYKMTFKIFTGKKLNFGNYSCIPKKILEDVINISFIDFHYSAAIVKSKQSYKSIFCDKGNRYAGESNMSFYNLFIHGLKSLSIFYKEVFFRILILLFIINCVFLLNFKLVMIMKFNLILLIFVSIFFLYLYYLIKIRFSKDDLVSISNYRNLIKDIKSL
tara:strand:- start:2070 stop:2951 length:882 start_codon:yes stop_codon:yes gene_type:complete